MPLQQPPTHMLQLTCSGALIGRPGPDAPPTTRNEEPDRDCPYVTGHRTHDRKHYVSESTMFGTTASKQYVTVSVRVWGINTTCLADAATHAHTTLQHLLTELSQDPPCCDCLRQSRDPFVTCQIRTGSKPEICNRFAGVVTAVS